MPSVRPTLLNSCAVAATTAEARFRMRGTTPLPRRSRVVALDGHAADVVRRVATAHRGSARFLTHLPSSPTVADDDTAPIVLTAANGDSVQLRDELGEADMIVLVASSDDGAVAVSIIGAEASRRGIMVSGLVLGCGSSARAAIRALRPHARVLLRSEDEDDLPDLLTALRA